MTGVGTALHYTLVCPACGRRFAEPADGMLLACDAGHGPALLRSEYASGRLDVDGDGSGIFRWSAWLPARRVVSGPGRPVVFRSQRLAARLGMDELWLAFSGWWPERAAFMETCSFKELEAAAVLARLPEGFGAVWDPQARWFDGGRVVVGGTPRRVVRLSGRAREALAGLGGPEVVPVEEAVATRLVRPLLDGGLLHPVPGPARAGGREVTVVVPVRDRAAELAGLLAQLAGVAGVIVVDDGSQDASAAVAAAAGAEVVRRPVPGGPAAARNAGLAAVRTALVRPVDAAAATRAAEGRRDVARAHGWDQAAEAMTRLLEELAAGR